MKTRRKRHKAYDRTYRTEPGQGVYLGLVQPLLGQKVVVYLDDPSRPLERQWRAGLLVGLLPSQDQFIIRWSKNGSGQVLKGIWRVHPRSLFTGTNLLPIPRYPARLPQSTNHQRSKEERMATKKAPAKKAGTTKKSAPKAAASNGAKKSTGATAKPRVTDKLEGLTEAKRRNIAKLIFRERSKSPATSWPDITQMIEDKYDWALPGSMTGRRLLREYGPDEAEDAIIKQDRAKAKAEAKAGSKTKAPKKSRAKKAAPVVEEDEDDEELEDEELDEEELEEELDEDIDEDEEDEDEDELDEEDEEEEEPPTPKRRVKVSRGRGKKANPSK